jgi:glutaminyl-peptide cyclotransferase
MAKKRRGPNKTATQPPAKEVEASSPAAPPERETVRVSEPPRRFPYWLLGLVGLVVAAVAIVQLGNEEPTAGQDIEELPMDTRPTPPERLRVRVVRRYPHDTSAFTQGLLWHEGHLYESTGLRGQSTLRKVDLETGEVLQRRDVDEALFAEGLALVGSRLFQLTWQNGQAHVWSLDDFRHERTFRYQGEGWGLCYDGQHLVMSDGSSRLSFRDPETFRVIRQVTVRQEGRALRHLNELECVDGQVWANVWQTDRIVRIDPRTGHVTAVVDASGLLTEQEALDVDVLNGIAWIPERRRFVITGKLWPHLFEVELEPES